MSFPRYERYKDSGLEWLDEIPEHWDVRRLKHFADVRLSNVDKHSVEGQTAVRLCNYVDVYRNERVTASIDFMRATASAEQIERLSLHKGDVVITKDSEDPSDIGIPALVAEDIPELVCGYHLAIVRPLGADGGFLSYLFRGNLVRSIFEVESTGMTRYALGKYSIENLICAAPPAAEQPLITAFLDRETATIDALIADQRRLIELLKEKRQAVISHAVTKGLNPDAPMKDSGVEWLGEVPEHWQIKPLKRISPIITVGVVVNPSNYVTDQGLPFIYGGDIHEGWIDWENARCISDTASKQNAKTRLCAGDLVTVRVGAPGITAVVPHECAGGNCASVMLIRQGSFDSHWLCYVMNSRVVRYQVEVVQYGAAQEQFNISHAVNFWVPAPQLREQQAIATFLDRETARIDTLVSEAETAIALLQERRTALISAAVTGKIDVRGLVAARDAVPAGVGSGADPSPRRFRLGALSEAQMHRGNR